MSLTEPNVRSTKHYKANGVKILVYGREGAGKTRLCATLPSPIILSVEAGLLSLADYDIPSIEIATLEDLSNAFKWLAESEQGKQYQSICLDSITEICETILSNEKLREKDGRKAYGNMNEKIIALVKLFRDIPDRNIYMSAKMDRMEDDINQVVYAPSLPGKKAQQDLPYYFDEVFALRVERDSEGVPHRMILTQPDGRYTAKDRSGKLDMWEKPDLGAIIRKIKGESDG